MSNLKKAAVKRVIAALDGAGLTDRVVELEETARSAADAAKALGVEQGAIVKSLTFTVGDETVLALVAGDQNCLQDNLPRALNREGEVARPKADAVKKATGFTIGGVAPVGSTHELPTVVDASLKRFETLYAAAGHPHCVFPVTFKELARITGGIVSYNIAEAQSADAAAEAIQPPKFPRSKTFARRVAEQAAAAEGGAGTGENA